MKIQSSRTRVVAFCTGTAIKGAVVQYDFGLMVYSSGIAEDKVSTRGSLSTFTARLLGKSFRASCTLPIVLYGLYVENFDRLLRQLRGALLDFGLTSCRRWLEVDQSYNCVTLAGSAINAIATRMRVDPAIASTFLAEYLPKIVDKLTPAARIDLTADHRQGVAALLPSLLRSLGGQSSSDGPAHG